MPRRRYKILRKRKGRKVTVYRKGKYIRERVEDPSKFDKRSFRVVEVKPGVKVIVGCPRGQWSPSTKKCKVGTRLQAILKER